MTLGSRAFAFKRLQQASPQNPAPVPTQKSQLNIDTFFFLRYTLRY